MSKELAGALKKDLTGALKKDLAGVLKKVSSAVQSAAPCQRMVADVCAQFERFTGAHVLLTDGRGKLVVQTSKVFRLRESVDGFYIDSKISDRLHEIDVLSCLSFNISGEIIFSLTNDRTCRYVLILPLYVGSERIATVTAFGKNPFHDTDIMLSEASVAVIVLILEYISLNDSSDKRRNTEAVKIAIGNLSYSEFAAILRIFHEIGSEGLTVVAHIADKLGIARSVVVNALRKLEGAGIVETRSLGVKGTYIKVLNNALLEELYKIS